jgi:hypothetical protein
VLYPRPLARPNVTGTKDMAMVENIDTGVGRILAAPLANVSRKTLGTDTLNTLDNRSSIRTSLRSVAPY